MMHLILAIAASVGAGLAALVHLIKLFRGDTVADRIFSFIEILWCVLFAFAVWVR